MNNPDLFPGSSSVVGAGSQPEDPNEARFDFLEMPEGMTTYAMPQVPEPDDVSGIHAAQALLDRVKECLDSYRVGDPAKVFDLADLDDVNRAFVDQALGNGEVSAIGGDRLQVQESVLTGVWRVFFTDENGRLERDFIEVADFPRALLDMARDAAEDAPPRNLEQLPDGVYNAPPLLTEVEDALARFTPDAGAHSINLSLLPLTDEDAVYLDNCLGKGPVTVLSRGYGNCRITSTGTRDVWWVRYFNSRDVLILNSIEIVTVPDVACAAQEDIDDSAERLGEILEIYR